MKRLLLVVVSCVVYVGAALAEHKTGHMEGDQYSVAVGASESSPADVKNIRTAPTAE